MSHFQQHPAFFNKPIILTEEERKNPIRVIIDFFTDYNLSEVREIHQNIDHVCLTSNVPPFDDPEERDSLLSFRESEEKVMEAALLLMESEPNVSPTPERPHLTVHANGEEVDTMDLDDVQSKVHQLQNQLKELQSSIMKTTGGVFNLRFSKK